MIEAPNGRWWLDDGADSGVWPCEVVSVNIFGATVRVTHPNGPYQGETITVDRKRVYDNRFNHPEMRSA